MQDFEKPYLKGEDSSIIMSNSPSYTGGGKTSKAIDGPGGSRINYRSPGQRGNIISYTRGKLDGNQIIQGGKVQEGEIGPVDKINALPIYQTTDGHANEDKDINDLTSLPEVLDQLNKLNIKEN